MPGARLQRPEVGKGHRLVCAAIRCSLAGWGSERQTLAKREILVQCNFGEPEYLLWSPHELLHCKGICGENSRAWLMPAPLGLRVAALLEAAACPATGFPSRRCPLHLSEAAAILLSGTGLVLAELEGLDAASSLCSFGWRS